LTNEGPAGPSFPSGLGYRSAIEFEDLGGVHVERPPEIAETVADPLAECAQLLVVDRLHRRFELAHVRSERGELGVDERR
jgi:hypothetical protein